MEDSSGQKDWYLGIDVGGTGISAALLNSLTRSLYPLYWSLGQEDSSERSFRFPAVAYIKCEARTVKGELIPPSLLRGTQRRALPRPTSFSLACVGLRQPPTPDGLLLQNFKADLQFGIASTSMGLLAAAMGIEPFAPTPQQLDIEPVWLWSEGQQLPLCWVLRSLQALLANSLGAESSPKTQNSLPIVCGAAGMERSELQTALGQLRGAILSQPAGWSDSYSFNLREAVLGAKLVERAEQIVVVEDAIATLLSVVRGGRGKTVVVPSSVSEKLNLFNATWQGYTLAIDAGATTTELALVNLPEKLENLTYNDFHLHSFPYAGNAIDQDIICSLFLELSAIGSSGEKQVKRKKQAYSLLNRDSSLLSDLELPRVGELDEERRRRLQLRLQSSPEGEALLKAAQELKLQLQNQDRVTVEWENYQWIVSQKELENKVFWPFIQLLNKELNALLSRTGMSVEAIAQAICTGGTGGVSAIARWLRQKLPNATIIQDTYSEGRPLPCSRVAYGLATLPLHPQVLDVHRQQYSDYFLLAELLRAIPDQPLSFGEILQLLERRGINTRASQHRIKALLEGDLPPGLVLPEEDTSLLTPANNDPDSQGSEKDSPDLGEPLFYKEDDRTYRLNQDRCERLCHYLKILTAKTQQNLEEPLPILDFRF